MSDEIHRPGIATARPTITVVRTGPFVIRHLAPGKPFLQFRGGEYALIHPARSDEMPRLAVPERLRYRFNLWLISRQATRSVAPLLSLRSSPSARRGSRVRAAASRWRVVLFAKVRGSMRAVLSMDVKAVGRGALTAVLGFMALIGATRFVHVDVATVFQSFHFSVPHFLTAWRRDGSGSPTPTGQPYAFAAVQYYGNITPSTFTPPAAANSTQAGDDANRSRKPDTGWLPLPGGGPFPMNMPDYGEDGQKRPLPLKVRPAMFSPPEGPSDDEGASDSAVALLGSTSAPVAAPAEPTPAPAHASPKKEGQSRAVAAQTTHEPVTPREGNRPTPLPKPSQPQPVQQPQSPNRDTVDVQLLPAMPQPASVTTRVQGYDGQQGQEQGGSSDGKPKFRVITKTDDALVVMDRGQMKQISVGQTLPDGSTLLSVKQNGGGFTTSRGNYVAY